MIKRIEVQVLPKDLENWEKIRQSAIKKSKLPENQIIDARLAKRSIDARGRQPLFRVQVDLYINEAYEAPQSILETYNIISNQKKCIIVGAGPAGYFAALELIELGIQPIIFDRGKDVRARRRDLKAIQRDGIVNADSNYCFGEGGAGTYSDGKLYTRSQKRGNILKTLRLLVEHGATTDILIDAHPHIGTNKLPKIVANIRETILKFGGEIHFDSKVTDFIIQDEKTVGVIVNDEKEHFADSIILATGHSARDIFEILHQRKITIEAKPFALGVRVEHPQPLIDRIQYRQPKREENLPASSYKLVCQVKDRGVFSFCMCPGGMVVPASTAPGEIVVNGMSPSKRDSPYANSGTVVSVELEDLTDFEEFGVFAGLEFQKHVEQTMFKASDGSQRAPAQRMTDFIHRKTSKTLPKTSYVPGLISSNLHELLPSFIYERLRQGMIEFGKKMKGYYTEEAVVIGIESRTSSPIRIPRNRKTYMHEDVEAFFPCGEGAGYAGGILSAAMDGQNVAKGVSRYLEGIG
ncbi:MAG: NAD(P)/FAD-dependent oxidoreductase [Saprospiraceae bacterium]|mgnify:CR=1 FL=1